MPEHWATKLKEENARLLAENRELKENSASMAELIDEALDAAGQFPAPTEEGRMYTVTYTCPGCWFEMVQDAPIYLVARCAHCGLDLQVTRVPVKD